MGIQVAGMQWPLAGRAGELEAFTQAWGDDRYRVVVVSGPMGVGKTRLGEEFLAQAARGGWTAKRVTATAAAANVPLGAMAHLIPREVDLADPVRGFAQVAQELVGPQRDRRLVLLVDDLQLLDAASAVLLRQLLDSDLARLIVTIGTGAPLNEAVSALTGGDSVRRIDVDPFRPDQVEQVLRAALGGTVGQRTLHELYTASDGNALYLRELVIGALAARTLCYDGEIWELAPRGVTTTPRLTELVEAVLAAADPAAGDLLELLALCDSVSLARAASLVSLEVLTELELAGLLRTIADRQRIGVALAHPLYGEILRKTLPPVRRRQLLLAQADWVESQGAKRRDDPLHVASWRLAATGTADARLLMQAAILASYAHDYQQVDNLLQHLPEGQRTFASCMLHGNALMELGRWQEVDKMLADAEARASGEEEQVASALIPTWNLFWIMGRPDQALRVNQSALARLTAPAQQHLLRLNEGVLRTLSGEVIRGLTLLEDLETEAKDAANINLWMFGAMGKTCGLATVGRSSAAIAWGEHAYASHLLVEEQGLGGFPPIFQLAAMIPALVEAGKLAKAREIAERALRDTKPADIGWPWVYAAYFKGRVEWFAGNVAAARSWYAEAIAQARAHDHLQPIYSASAGLAAAAAVLGDLEAAEAALVAVQEYPSVGLRGGEEDLGQAWLWAGRGDLAKARSVLTDAASRLCSGGHVSSEMMLLTDVARLGGSKEVVDRLTELAEVCEGAFAPARAHFAAALAADAPDRLLAAAEELEAIGADLLAAEAAAAAAAAWRRAGETRRATAAARLSRQYAIRCPGACTPLLLAAQTTVDLTSREREVARLAATGASSKDIATSLHLSVRTVDNHLQHVYAKLGVATRRELAERLR